MKEYKIIITDDADEFYHLDLYDHPENGEYVASFTITTVSEFKSAIAKYEGYYYLMFDGKEKIGSGVFESCSPIEEIVSNGIECCGNCNECFWYKLASFNLPYYEKYFTEWKPEKCFINKRKTERKHDEKMREL